MKAVFRRSYIIITSLFISVVSVAQGITGTPPYDPNDKIIPDKVFEMGVPLLVLYLIANTIMSIFRIKAENRLKEKALDKGISEATLIALFQDDKKMARLIYLKWFLVLAALGIAFIFIHILADYIKLPSGYLAVGLITLLIAIAFFIYYRIIQKQ